VALRDGKRVGELARADATEEAMIRLMIGRDIAEFFPGERNAAGNSLLKVAGLRRADSPHPVSFELRAGEVLGFAGLVGAGRTETMRALFGIDPILDGTIEIGGQPIRIGNVRDAVAAGMAMVPEDRKLQGLILEMSIEQNISLAGLRRFSPWGIMNRVTQRKLAEEQRERLKIKTPSIRQLALNLSGGNQQKVVLGKWLALEPKILILDEPTRGIDVNSKAEIYHLMRELTRRGVGIIMISSDMEEVLGVSDRIIVMHEGKIAGELRKEHFSEEAVMTLAAGKSFNR
ncbi:sugar ABC transporter ATP-binding protein, partial [Candidatus Sumerlaeota bacterium]|nr:sugar ABC transporter ATP-binding protein [Candidatus Sumerlaeota bacterium]